MPIFRKRPRLTNQLTLKPDFHVVKPFSALLSQLRSRVGGPGARQICVSAMLSPQEQFSVRRLSTVRGNIRSMSDALEQISQALFAEPFDYPGNSTAHQKSLGQEILQTTTLRKEMCCLWSLDQVVLLQRLVQRRTTREVKENGSADKHWIARYHLHDWINATAVSE